MFLDDFENQLNIDVSKFTADTMLMEANRALDIFSDEFYKWIDENQQALKGTLGHISDARRLIKEDIQGFQKLFKKQDRVLWYARQLKLYYLSHLQGLMLRVYSIGGEDVAVELAEFVQREVKKLKKKTSMDIRVQQYAISVDGVPPPAPWEIVNNLEHFYSLGFSEIDNWRFTGKESWSDIKSIFTTLEDKWKETLSDKRLIPVEHNEEDAEIFLQTRSNLAWWDIKRAGCEFEGEAMGHCGNVPSARSGQTILSLRETVMLNHQEFHKPYATFIYNYSNGSLGEMKGVYNEKPRAEFHDDIIQLILDDRIERIDGGGYLPENNFALTDLDPDDQQLILQKKPDLFSLYALVVANEFEMDDTVKDMIKDAVGEDVFDGYNMLAAEFEDIDDLVSGLTSTSTFQFVYEKIRKGDEVDIDEDKIYDENIRDAMMPLDMEIEVFMHENHPDLVHRYVGDWFVAFKNQYPDVFKEIKDAYINRLSLFGREDFEEKLIKYIKSTFVIDDDETENESGFYFEVGKEDKDNWLDSKQIKVWTDWYGGSNGDTGIQNAILEDPDIEPDQLPDAVKDQFENYFWHALHTDSGGFEFDEEDLDDLSLYTKEVDLPEFRGDVRIILAPLIR